jgi:DNA-binding NtrC family response regulator
LRIPGALAVLFPGSSTGCKRIPGYRWPGNLLQLEHMVRRVYVHDRDANAAPSPTRPSIRSDDPLATLVRTVVTGDTTWEESERQVVAGVLEKTKSRREGARRLAMDRERFTWRQREALGDTTPRKNGEKADT